MRCERALSPFLVAAASGLLEESLGNESLSPTMSPRTSRPPSSVMPVAMTTAWETIWWFTRALQ